MMNLDARMRLDDSFSSECPRVFSHEYKIGEITDVFTFVHKLGQGVYGDVFLGKLREKPDEVYAIKRVRQTNSPIESIFGLEQNIVKEIHALSCFSKSHVNIVRLCDYCSAYEQCKPTASRSNSEIASGETKMCIVYYFVFELCDMDLHKLVKTQSERYLPYEADLFKSLIKSHEGEYMTHDIINYSVNVFLSSGKLANNVPLPGFTELDTKAIAFQILIGLVYLHSHRIIHRDIKPQNILLKKLENEVKGLFQYEVKLADFGLSTIMAPRQVKPMTEEVVTLLYRPPELLLGNRVYTTAIDVWSVAVTIGECVLGKPMFKGRSEFGVLMRIFSLIGHPAHEDLKDQLGLLKYYNDKFPKIEREYERAFSLFFTDKFGRRLLSRDGIDLLKRMLEFNPSKRITAFDALQHPWFDDVYNYLPESVQESDVVQRLLALKTMRRPEFLYCSEGRIDYKEGIIFDIGMEGKSADSLAYQYSALAA